MPSVPFQAQEDVSQATSLSATASPVQQKELLLSVLSRAISINNQECVHTSSMLGLSPPPKKSSRRCLKKAIKNTLASKTTARIEEMNRMTKIAMSRPSDDDASHDHYDDPSQQKDKTIYAATSTDFCNTPIVQDGRLMLSLPPPPPPKRRTLFISSGEGELLIEHIASANLDNSPESTPEGRHFQCQPRFTSPWLLDLNRPHKRNQEIAPIKRQVSTPMAALLKVAEEPKQLKTSEVGLTRSSSKGGLLRNRLASMSKLSPRSNSFSTTTKRLKSFNSLLHSKDVNSVVPGEDNHPQANSTWDTTPSVKLIQSLNAHQKHQASPSLQRKIVVPDPAKMSYKSRPSHEDPKLVRLNKSLGNLSLGRQLTGPEGKESPKTNATLDKVQPPKLNLSRSRSSFGNLRRKKIAPGGATSPSQNATWGAM